MTPRKFRLRHKRAPGDITVMTGFVRDLKRHLGEYVQIEVATSHMALWQNNPYITELPPDDPRVEEVVLTYHAGIRGEKSQKFRTIHFLPEFHRDFAVQTGIHVPLTEPKPDLHLSDAERRVSPISGRYWVFLSGGKSDFTIKVWHDESWKRTAAMLQERGLPLVQLGAVGPGHWHPEIPGTLDLVGKTSLRDMVRLIYHADGVICGVTAAMHMAAALEKPCVVVAGGREAWWWEAYVNENADLQCGVPIRVPHRFLHTIGLLECCSHFGCWKNKVLPLNEDKLLCKKPLVKPGQPVAACMDMIKPEHVVEAVMSYYTDRTLPPISQPAPTLPAVEFIQVQPVPPRLVAPLEGVRATTPERPRTTSQELFDHPAIGGKLTMFVLMYGPRQYHKMHRKCVDSIISSVPADRLDLRIGSNELCDESVAYVEDLVTKGLVTKHYRHRTNDKKYPVMREMFWDESHPITTKWIVWFDDDSIADRNRMWVYLLLQKIINEEGKPVGIIGPKFFWDLKPGQAELYKTRPWYKGRPFRDRHGSESPNGNKVWFSAGGFWAMPVAALRAADVPDTALGHNGGDYTIGEQLWQAGYTVAGWNSNKQFVHTSSVPRRGLSEPHFGTKSVKKEPRTIIIT